MNAKHIELLAKLNKDLEWEHAWSAANSWHA